MYYKIEYGLGCGYKNVSLPSIYSSIERFSLLASRWVADSVNNMA